MNQPLCKLWFSSSRLLMREMNSPCSAALLLLGLCRDTTIQRVHNLPTLHWTCSAFRYDGETRAGAASRHTRGSEALTGRACWSWRGSADPLQSVFFSLEQRGWDMKQVRKNGSKWGETETEGDPRRRIRNQKFSRKWGNSLSKSRSLWEKNWNFNIKFSKF